VARLPSVLTQVSDILQLRPEEAAQQLAVRLRGVITYADPAWRNGFLQDRGDAIYVDLDPAQKTCPIRPMGRTDRPHQSGRFCAGSSQLAIEVLGVTNLPTPAHVDLEDLANGRFDSHWVEMEGLVRRVDELSGHVSLSLMTPKGRFKVIIPDLRTSRCPPT
jgi:hypothetical protein